MSQDQAANIPLRDIIEPIHLLRLVDKGSLDYREMHDSVRDYGLLNSISVRPSEKYEGKYELVEGLWRYSVARQLRWETIPCIVKESLDDTETLFAQIIANATWVETKPCEFADHIDRILKMNVDMTFVELAGKLRKDVGWIQDTLSLRSLKPEIQRSLDRGELPVKSARLLAKLPKQWQEKLVRQAQLYPYAEFSPIVREAIKNYREGIRQGRMAEFYELQFKPHPFYRSLRESTHEMMFCENGAVYIATENLSPIAAWKRAVEWVLHMDPKGVEAQERLAKSKKDKMDRDIRQRKEERDRIENAENLANDLTNDEL